MAMPPLMVAITDSIYRLPAPISTAWRIRNGLHEVVIEPGINRVQASHFWFRRNVAWRALGVVGVPQAILDSSGRLHERAFGRLYSIARHVSWYL
ncbi:hypothetical protein JK358_33995 [Nocardia sp. 2]|uniref:Uncharacterized protein n=1 Tax=Nocardia acididurans TaxID=2802282 RepID=A0ABS1MFJ0_9NOCA|nr:hypothetical protein [Nocardia acididurans]MBL1079430.1 hypothetical protein [Nocardia acididurans]